MSTRMMPSQRVQIIAMYGTMASYGDIAQRRGRLQSVVYWDLSSQEAISVSQKVLGPVWIDCCLHAPIWHSAIWLSALGQQVWTTVLVPNADRAGYYFPLLLLSVIPLETSVPDIFLRCKPWLAEPEDIGNVAPDAKCQLSQLNLMLEKGASTMQSVMQPGAPREATALSSHADAFWRVISFGVPKWA